MCNAAAPPGRRSQDETYWVNPATTQGGPKGGGVTPAVPATPTTPTTPGTVPLNLTPTPGGGTPGEFVVDPNAPAATRPTVPTTAIDPTPRPGEFGGTPAPTGAPAGFGPSGTTSPGAPVQGGKQYQWMTDWLADLGQRRPDLMGQRVNVFDPQFGFKFGDDGSWNGPLPDEYRNGTSNGGFIGIKDNSFQLGGRGDIGGVGLGGTLDHRDLGTIGRGGTMRDALGTYGFAGSVGGTVNPNAPLYTPSTPTVPTPTTPTTPGTPGPPVDPGTPTILPTTPTLPGVVEPPTPTQTTIAPLPAAPKYAPEVTPPTTYQPILASGAKPGANNAVVSALMKRFRPDAWF